jgi:electron transfer flavoprotein alpha subunit
MSELLVLIDHADGEPRKLSLQMLTAATQIAGETGDTVAAVWLGEGASGAADTLGAHGAAKLYHWDSADAQGYVTLPQVEALEAAFEQSGAETLLFPRATTPRTSPRGWPSGWTPASSPTPPTSPSTVASCRPPRRSSVVS